MYAQVRDIIARCEQCDRVRTSFLSTAHAFSTPYSGYVLSLVM
jgi:hypothetical protein